MIIGGIIFSLVFVAIFTWHKYHHNGHHWHYDEDSRTCSKCGDIQIQFHDGLANPYWQSLTGGIDKDCPSNKGN